MAEKWFHKSFPYRIREKALTLDAAKKHNAEYMRRLKKCYSFDLTLVEPDGSEKPQPLILPVFWKKTQTSAKISKNAACLCQNNV